MSDEANDYSEITLDAKLASTAAPGLFAQLKELRDQTVVLNASEVEQIGVLCMQILMSASKTWTDEGRSFEVVEPSEAFLSTIDVAGVSAEDLGIKKAG